MYDRVLLGVRGARSLDKEVIQQQQHEGKAPDERQHLLVLLVVHDLHTTETLWQKQHTCQPLKH